MPKIIHEVEYPYYKTFRTEKVAGIFDISPEKKLIKKWNIDLPIEDFEKDKKDWNIGLIVGASGSGKTILSKKIFGEENYYKGFEWNSIKSFLEDFPENIEISEITDALSHVGFSSPPAWLLPFHILSNGQKFRAEIARIFFEYKNLCIIDEFTSVIDRNVAKIGCAAIQKFIRKKDRKIVAVSCHYDIIDWLEPDWVFDVSANKYFRRCLRRPSIKLEIYKCKNDLWQLFREHHYLSGNLLKSAQCFVGIINGFPACFSSYIHFPHEIINCKREHRTVVLPDYQGVGIGNRISDWVAQYCLNNGFRYYSLTSHPAMIFSRIKSKKWIILRKPSITMILNFQKRQFKRSHNKENSSYNRITASFKYLGNSKIDC